MYKLCKTEQSATRQRELEQGLLAAMSVRRYEEISVSDLCDHMGIPRKSFYRYFSSKDGALHALIDHTLLEFESFSASFGREKRTYQRELEKFFQFWKNQLPLLDALNRSDLTGMLVMRSVDHAMSDMGIPNRFLQQEHKMTKEYATMFGVCGLMSLILHWYQSGFDVPISQMASIATELVTTPLFSADVLK